MRPALPLVAAALLAVPLTAAAGPKDVEVRTISSGLTGPCGTSATTADVAVRGRTVVATWLTGGGEQALTDLGVGRAVSTDGGRTFTATRLLATCAGGPLDIVVDPDVAVGADGTPWLSASGSPPPSDAAVALEPGDPAGTVLVQVGDGAPRSVFPGTAAERGFLETHADDPATGWVLGETLTGGRAKVGPVAGGQRVLGGPEGRLVLGTTHDRGATWQVSTLRTPQPGTGMLALGLVRTGRALVALSTEYDMKDAPSLAAIGVGAAQALSKGRTDTGVPIVPLAAQTSLDGGRTWSAPVVLGTLAQGTVVDASANDDLVAVAAPQLDGRLLVFTGRDDGRTWRRTTATTGVAQPSTAVAVDRTGRVGVLSYAQDGSVLTPQLSLSRDGLTFAAPVALAEPFDADAMEEASEVHPFGPWQGAAADGRELLVAFTAKGPGATTEARLARVR